jgi:hypothetical protein
MSVNKKIIETEATPPQTAGFNAVTYTGNGGTQTITGVGFQPDVVWIKSRNAIHAHMLYDSNRGTSKYLVPSETTAELTRTNQITSVNSDGFALSNNADVNESGTTYVAWCWKANEGTTSSDTNGSVTTTVQANAAAKFSIATSATGRFHPNYSFGHGLGDTPELIIVRARGFTSEWRVYSSYVNSWNGFLQLNSDVAQYTTSISTTVNSTTISGNWVPDSATYDTSWQFYSFKSVSGFSKFGTYTATGGNQTITLGFQPRFIILKAISRLSAWLLMDTARDTTSPFNDFLVITGGAEFYAPALTFSYNSTGFTITNTDGTFNDSGETYLYMAFAEAP